MNATHDIELFFDRYEERVNEAITGKTLDVEEIASCFADCFVEASPVGVTCGKNDNDFRNAIPKGYTFYKDIGITSMEILSKKITLLDHLHTMARISWRSNFFKDQKKGSIDFDVIYLLQCINKKYKIFAYITGDEQAALKEHGLL